MVHLLDAPLPANMLVDLPVDLIDYLSAELSLEDKNAMRTLSRRSRDAMNSTLTKLCLCTADLRHLQEPQSTPQAPLLARFPRVKQLTLKDADQAGLTDELLCNFLASHLQQAGPPYSMPVKSHHQLRTGSAAQQQPQASVATQQHPHAAATDVATHHHLHASPAAQHHPHAASAAQRSPYCPSRLHSLSMKYCHYLSRTSMRQVARCTGLKQLSMSRWVDASALEELCGVLPVLENLDLGDEFVDVLSVDDSALSVVARAGPTLTSLSLDRCLMVSDSALSSLVSNLPKLQSLSISGCPITSLALQPAALQPAAVNNASGAAATGEQDHLGCLQVLNLSRCSSFGTNLKQGSEADGATLLLPPLPSLQVLSLGGTAILNDQLSQLLLQVPNLRCLHLGSDFELNDNGLAALACLPALTELSFGNLNITRPPGPNNTAWGGADRLASPYFHKLKKLHFGGTFINRGMAHVFPLPCALEELTIQSFDALRDHQMELFARQATLRTLKLSGGYQLTTTGLLSLKPLSQLREMVLVCCPHITPHEAGLLLQGLPQVQEIKILRSSACVEANVIRR